MTTAFRAEMVGGPYDGHVCDVMLGSCPRPYDFLRLPGPRVSLYTRRLNPSAVMREGYGWLVVYDFTNFEPVRPMGAGMFEAPMQPVPPPGVAVDKAELLRPPITDPAQQFADNVFRAMAEQVDREAMNMRPLGKQRPRLGFKMTPEQRKQMVDDISRWLDGEAKKFNGGNRESEGRTEGDS